MNVENTPSALRSNQCLSYHRVLYLLKQIGTWFPRRANALSRRQPSGILSHQARHPFTTRPTKLSQLSIISKESRNLNRLPKRTKRCFRGYKVCRVITMPLKFSERQALTRYTNVAFSNTRTACPKRTPCKRGTYCKKRSQKSDSHHCRVWIERQEEMRVSPHIHRLATARSRISARKEWQPKVNFRKPKSSSIQLGQLSIRLTCKCRKLHITMVMTIDKRWPFKNCLI